MNNFLILDVVLMLYVLNIVGSFVKSFTVHDMDGNLVFDYPNGDKEVSSKFNAKLNNLISQSGIGDVDSHELDLVKKIYFYNKGFFEPLRTNFSISEWNLELWLYHWTMLFITFPEFRKVAIAVANRGTECFTLEDVVSKDLHESIVAAVLGTMVQLNALDYDGKKYRAKQIQFSDDVQEKAKNYLERALCALNKHKKIESLKREITASTVLRDGNKEKLVKELDHICASKDIKRYIPSIDSDITKGFFPFLNLI